MGIELERAALRESLKWSLRQHSSVFYAPALQSWICGHCKAEDLLDPEIVEHLDTCPYGQARKLVSDGQEPG